MEDLHIRVPRQNANAARLAAYLSGHKNILEVKYPLISNGALAQKVIRPADGGDAYGAMLSVRLRGGGEAANKFLYRMTEGTYIKNQPSLGHTITTVESPSELSQAFMLKEDKEFFGG